MFRLHDVLRLCPGERALRHVVRRFHDRSARRVWEHKTRAVRGFTATYGVDRLVWFEAHETLEAALVRERQIKEWKRDWKINLIERENPH
jgi:putative endonuclease